MKSKILCLVLLAATAFILPCHSAPFNTNEMEANMFLDKVNETIYTFLNNAGKEIFELFDEIDDKDRFENYMTLLKKSQQMVAIVNESKAFDYSAFKDTELRNIFKTIRKFAGEAIVGDERYSEMITSAIQLDGLGSDRDIEPYANSSANLLAYFPDIYNIFAKSDDPDELKYYWNAWRERNEEWAKQHLGIVVEIINDAANLTDISASEFWLRDYNITEMENVMTQIQPIYQQLHAFIRNQLHKKYGDQVINPNGPIPDHLFQQVLAQAWTNGSVIDEMYPHKDLPPFDMILEKNNYDAPKLYKTADMFYKSLGFEPIPETIWDTQIKMNKDEDEGDCRATVFDFTYNVYMQYCQKMDFRKFLQAHGSMGRLYYAREKKDLPAYYFSSHDLEYPVGESVILSASTPKHLNAIGMVTDFKFTDEVLMNRLLRMSIHTLLNIPVYFVHTKVMADLFAGTIEFEQLNKHYWMLMDKYVGVEPPIDRNDESHDFPFKFYIDLNENQQAMKFDSEVLGYQFYKKFCEISGQYPKEPLQNCDFYGSKSVGDAMKKMMKLGSSKEFNEVLAALLPENPTVNAESMLEYYSPIKTWLKAKNTDANVKVGWTHTDKKY